MGVVQIITKRKGGFTLCKVRLTKFIKHEDTPNVYKLLTFGHNNTHLINIFRHSANLLIELRAKITFAEKVAYII